MKALSRSLTDLGDTILPRVTIISAYHKRPDAVRVTLEAITRQDYDDWQALVWDDCSPDDTWAVLQDAAREIDDPRIEVFRHDPNLGFAGGMNHAIRRSQSEYVAVVGSGDAFDGARISRQVAALDADPAAAFCTTGAVSIDPDTGARFVDNSFSRTRIVASDLFDACPFTHGSVMFRRSALDRAGVYEPAFVWSSDWDLFNRLLARSHAIHLPQPLYLRYARADGASFSPTKSVLQVKFAHLAHLLRETPADRASILTRVREQGLDAAIHSRSPAIASDLHSRRAKLYILGRRDEADELGRLIADEFPAPRKWRVILGALRRAGGPRLVRFYNVAQATNRLRKTARRRLRRAS